jgi:beta-lactamase class D
MNNFVLIILTYILFPALAGCQPETEIADYKSLFDEYEVSGCFILQDLTANKILKYNPSRCDSGFIPASTFKIPHALIALETGVAADKDFTIKWDGVTRGVKSWNKDHTLETAIRNSVVWYFEKIAKLIGKSALREWLNKIDYGNKDVSGDDPFWLRGNLRITPNEQLEFMYKFYNEQLPFSKKNVNIVKDAILIEEGKDYKIHAKTGWAQNSKDIGWVTGYLEAGGNVYLFVTNVESDLDNNKFIQSRIGISKSILADYTGISFNDN